jgi:putative FmdB family regulatory protein
MGAANPMLYYDFCGLPEGLFVPLYEYLCSQCGHRFEKIESSKASETKKCPKCGAKAKRVLTAAAFQFKGSGWYATDYGGKSSGGDSKKAETTSTESSKATPAKESAPAKETKPARKEKT